MSDIEFDSSGETSGFFVDFEVPTGEAQEPSNPCRCKCEQLLLPDGQLVDMNTDAER